MAQKSMLIPLLTGCVALGNLLNLSVPVSSSVRLGDANMHFPGSLHILGDVKQLK